MWKGNNCLREPGTKVIWSIHWYSPIILLSVPVLKTREGPFWLTLVWINLGTNYRWHVEGYLRSVTTDTVKQNPPSQKCSTWRQGQILRQWNFLFPLHIFTLRKTHFSILTKKKIKKMTKHIFNRKWHFLRTAWKKALVKHSWSLV